MRATIVTSFCVGFLVAAPLWAADPDDAFEFKTLKARAAKSKFDLRRQLATRQYDQSRQTNVAKRDRALAEARAVLLVELREAREAAFKARNSQEIARLEKAMELVKKSGVPIASPPKAVKPPTGSVAVPRDAVKWKGHYYKVFDQTVTWYIAHRECERAGGHLVRIESAEEQAFISSMTAPPAARSQAY
ncbi:MAG: C-type lectin domain-containing protein, partial [Phycisphaerae bacterium]|nr:C-type lectin domain-containing protein [Phycisphaerae bacterium]